MGAARMKKANVSVIIPAFNAEKHIADAIKSVSAQTLPVSEIIVIDNNSTDRTAKIAKRSGAKVILETKQGSAAARNAGMCESVCEWIAFLDADDLWHKRKIELQMRAARAFPQAKLLTCEYQRVFLDTGKKKRNPRLKNALPQFSQYVSRSELIGFCDEITFPLYLHLFLRTSALVIHRSLLEEVGQFDEKLRMNQDIEYFIRLLKDNSVALVKKILVEYRRHDFNISHNKRQNMADTLHNLEKITRFPDNYIPGAEAAFREFIKMETFAAMRRKARLIAGEKPEPEAGEVFFEL